MTLASSEFAFRRKALGLLLVPALPGCQGLSRLKYGELPPGFKLQPLQLFAKFVPSQFELRLHAGENDRTRREKHAEASAALENLGRALYTEFINNFKNDAGTLGLKFRLTNIPGHSLSFHPKKAECRYFAPKPPDYSLKYGMITIWIEGKIWDEADRPIWDFETRVFGMVGGNVDVRREAAQAYQRLMQDFTTAMQQSGLIANIK